MRRSRCRSPLCDTPRPMDVLFNSLTPENFPDLFTLLWVASIPVIAGSVWIYGRAGRRYRRYPVLLSLHEWIFWPILIPWLLVPLFVVTGVPLLLVLLVVVPGLAVALYATFVRFPPRIAAANEEIRRRRFTPQSRPRPETRERPKPVPAGRRRRSGRR